MKIAQHDDNTPTRKASISAKELLGLIAATALFAMASSIVVPRGPSRSMQANIRSEANMENVAKSLAAFAARRGNTGGYPPAYGYLKPEAIGRPVESLSDADHILEPYTASVGIHEFENAYLVPRWTSSFDTDGDGRLGLMEYLPVGVRPNLDEAFTFSTTLYTGKNRPLSGDMDEVAVQLSEGRLRPYVYVPFNMEQLKILRRWWTDRGDALGEQFDHSDPRLAALTFPPDRYDGFALIGNGPGGNDGGLSAVEPPGTPGVDYDEHHVDHVLGLRIAFLATRDWAGDGKPDESASPQPDQLLDFDFRDRKQATHLCPLPDGTNGQGAMIKVVR